MDTETMMGISFLRYPCLASRWRLAKLLFTSLSATSPLAPGAATASAIPCALLLTWSGGTSQEQKTLLVCGPALAANVRTNDISRSSIYFMLHGSDTDGTRFWGEDAAARSKRSTSHKSPRPALHRVFRVLLGRIDGR